MPPPNPPKKTGEGPLPPGGLDDGHDVAARKPEPPPKPAPEQKPATPKPPAHRMVLDPELAAIQEVSGILARLDSPDSMRRVLDYVNRRL